MTDERDTEMWLHPLAIAINGACRAKGWTERQLAAASGGPLFAVKMIMRDGFSMEPDEFARLWTALSAKEGPPCPR